MCVNMKAKLSRAIWFYVAMVTYVTVVPFAAADASITEISIPTNSQDGACSPVNDSVWAVTAPPYPFRNDLGIGWLVNPDSSTTHGFTLHDHVYLSNNVPDPVRQTVTYRFDSPTTVADLEVWKGLRVTTPGRWYRSGTCSVHPATSRGAGTFRKASPTSSRLPMPSRASIFVLSSRRPTTAPGLPSIGHILAPRIPSESVRQPIRRLGKRSRAPMLPRPHRVSRLPCPPGRRTSC